MLKQAGMGIGSLGLASLLQQEGLAAGSNPMAARRPHFKTKAKAVIWLFINGGPSHVDTWDYKPELARRDGQALEGFDKFTGFFSNAVGGLMKSPFEFKQHGQCGKHVSSISRTSHSTWTKWRSFIRATRRAITIRQRSL